DHLRVQRRPAGGAVQSAQELNEIPSNARASWPVHNHTMTDSKNKKKRDENEGEESPFEGASTATAEPQKTEGVLYLGIDFGTPPPYVAASNGVRDTISSHVGYPKDVVSRKLVKKDVLFGDEALEKRLSLNFFRPLEILKTKNPDREDFDANLKAAQDLLK